jgi:hypothetical protein
MKKAILALSFLLILLPSGTLQAKKKSLVGIWDFPETNLLLEFSETHFNVYGGEPAPYKIVDNKLTSPDQTPATFKLKDKNTSDLA